MKADGSDVRIVSPNYAYVLGAAVAENITGEVQAVAHNGAWGIVLRRKSVSGGVYDDQLVQVPIGGTSPSERIIADGGSLDYAPNG